MADDNSDKSFGKRSYPTEPYDGHRNKYENFEMDKIAWAIRKKYSDYLESPDPASIPRVENDYDITEANDPHGPIGQRVRAETAQHYDARIARDVKKGKEIWSEGFTGTCSAARDSAMKAHQEQPFDIRHMYETLKTDFGNKTDKQSGSLVTESITKRKSSQQSITSFNNEWRENKRQLTTNGMNLPERYITNLYLASLGPKYSTLRTVANALPEEKRTLSYLMQLAVDHCEDDDNDEADTNSLALVAQLQQQGYRIEAPFARARTWDDDNHRTKRHQPGTAYRIHTDGIHDDSNTPFSQRPRCTICNHPYHDKATCFKPGGGLSHLSRAERGTWLEARRKARSTGHPPPLPPPPVQQQQQQGAAALASVTNNKNKQLDKIRKLISDAGIQLEGQEDLLSTEWTPE